MAAPPSALVDEVLSPRLPLVLAAELATAVGRALVAASGLQASGITCLLGAVSTARSAIA